MLEGHFGPPPGGPFGPPPGGPRRGGFNDGYSPRGNNWNRRSWYGTPSGYVSTPDYDFNVAIFPRLRTLVKCSIDKENSKFWSRYIPQMQAYGITMEEAKRSKKFKLQRAKNILKGTLFGVGRYLKEPFVNIPAEYTIYSKEKDRSFGNITDNEYNLAKVDFNIKKLNRLYRNGEIDISEFREALGKIKQSLAVVKREELNEKDKDLFDLLEREITEEKVGRHSRRR